MKTLSISGGSTKIAALGGSAITLLKDYSYKPEIICGISSGGLLALPLAMGLYNELEELITNFKLDDIFGKYKPVNNKGKLTIRSLFRLLTGKPSLGKQDELIETYKKLITRSRFIEYQNGNYPIVYIGSVGFKTGARMFTNLKKCSYDEFLLNMKSTSSIPGFVEPVSINDDYYFDGGVRDHIGSHWLFENFKISQNISIYSRPEDAIVKEPSWHAKNALTSITRAFEIMFIEISKNDESLADNLAEKQGALNTKIFMPHILSAGNGMYEFNKNIIREWYNIGCKATSDTLDV